MDLSGREPRLEIFTYKVSQLYTVLLILCDAFLQHSMAGFQTLTECQSHTRAKGLSPDKVQKEEFIHSTNFERYVLWMKQFQQAQ